MLRSLIILLLIANTATAGPWPRGKGRSFLSYTVSSLRDHSGTRHMDFNTIYAEYGLSPDYTIGLDIGFSGDRLEKAHAFLRFPPYQLGSHWLWASDFGLGISEHGRATLRSTTTFGRGFTENGVSGWVSVDLRTYFVAKKSHSWLETETTFGVNLNKDFKAILQWQDEYDVQDKYASHITTALIWEFYPGQYLETGATFGLINTDGQRIKIGFWHQF